jgi:hypothetical protein
MTEVVYRWQMYCYAYPENFYTYCGMCVCVYFACYLVYTLLLRVKRHLYISLFFYTLSPMMNILIMYCTLLQIIPGVLKLASRR